MWKYIACDMHTRNTPCLSPLTNRDAEEPVKVANDRLELDRYRKTLDPHAGGGGSQRSWYWFVDRLEQAGLDAASGESGGSEKADGRDATRPRPAMRAVWHAVASRHSAGGLDSAGGTPGSSGPAADAVVIATADDDPQEPHSRRHPALRAVRDKREAKNLFAGNRPRAAIGQYRGTAAGRRALPPRQE